MSTHLEWAPERGGIRQLKRYDDDDVYVDVVGYVDHLPRYEADHYRGCHYSRQRSSALSTRNGGSEYQMFYTLEAAKAWVYSLAVLEN